MSEFDGMKRIAVDVDPAPEDEEPEGDADALAELDALLAACQTHIAIAEEQAVLSEAFDMLTEARARVATLRGGAK